MSKLKIRSVEAVQKALDDLVTERENIAAKMVDIETKIADKWGTNTSALEVEHGSLGVRLKASEGVKIRLEDELLQAKQIAAIDAYKQAEKARIKSYHERDKFDDAIAEAEKALEAAKQAKADNEHSYRKDVANSDSAKKAAQELGVASTELHTS